MQRDEILANDTFQIFRKQILFYNFLKNIKKSTEKKYTHINIYYFSIKSGLRKFIDNISRNIKENHLYKLMITLNYSYNCKLFFSNIKKKILYIKYRRNKEKFKLKQSREFYAKKLKSKFLKTLSKNKNLKLIYQKRSYQLNRMISSYLSKKLIYMMKAFYNSKFHNLMKKKFIYKLHLTKLRKFYKHEEKRVEIDRIVRKFCFVNSTKKFISKIKKLHSSVLKRDLFFFQYYQKFFLNKFKKSLLKNKSISDKDDTIEDSAKKYSYLLFFKWIKRSMNFIKHNEPKCKKLINILDYIRMKKFFKNFEFYDSILIKNKQDLEAILAKRIFLKKIQFYLKINKEIQNKLDILNNSQVYKDNVKAAKLQLFRNLKLTLAINRKNKKATHFYNKNLKAKTFIQLYEVKNKLLEKKQKYILSLLTFNKNFIRKAFKILNTNYIIKKNKKEEYNNLRSQREKIVYSHLFKMLVINCSNEIKNKEDQIAQVFIKRSSRGISTALQWFKKLKSRVEMKKINKNLTEDNSRQTNNYKESTFNNGTINNNFSIYPTQNFLSLKSTTTPIICKEKIVKDVDLLISLKNKRRALPKKLEYN
jgi:hypothetical protein